MPGRGCDLGLASDLVCISSRGLRYMCSFFVGLMPSRNFRVALAGYHRGEAGFGCALMLDVERSLQVIKRGTDELLIKAGLIEHLKSGHPSTDQGRVSGGRYPCRASGW